MSAKVTTPWDGHYMRPAFIAFVDYAAKHRLAEYRAETGDNYAVEGGHVFKESSVDDIAFAERFLLWCVAQFGTPADLDSEGEE